MIEFPEVELQRPLSREEKQMLREYVDWIDKGAPNLEPFFRGIGLCGNAHCGSNRNVHFNGVFPCLYPFAYYESSQPHQEYSNPARIAWARANAAAKDTNNA
jgi:hypothetical protein